MCLVLEWDVAESELRYHTPGPPGSPAPSCRRGGAGERPCSRHKERYSVFVFNIDLFESQIYREGKADRGDLLSADPLLGQVQQPARSEAKAKNLELLLGLHGDSSSSAEQGLHWK